MNGLCILQNLNRPEDPIICITCFWNVQTFYTFKLEAVANECKIKSYYDLPETCTQNIDLYLNETVFDIDSNVQELLDKITKCKLTLT